MHHEFITANKTHQDEFVEAIDTLDGIFRASVGALLVHRRQWHSLLEDFTSDIERVREHRQKESVKGNPDSEPVAESNQRDLEHAYSNVISHKLHRPCGKKVQHLRGLDFRTVVYEFYGARRRRNRWIRKSWCHALGTWLTDHHVYTAQLVNESLAGHDLAYLFGVDELTLSDPRNGEAVFSTKGCF
jgi:hypothetical protein